MTGEVVAQGMPSEDVDGVLIDANGISINTATLAAANRLIRYFMEDFAGDDVRQDADSPTGCADMVQIYGIQGAAGWNLISQAFQRFFSGSWIDVATPITIGVMQPGTTVLGGNIRIYGDGADDPTYGIIVGAPFGAGKKVILFDLSMEIRGDLTLTGDIATGTHTPSSGTDTGRVGEICWDADYIYVCTATNYWRRTPITHW